MGLKLTFVFWHDFFLGGAEGYGILRIHILLINKNIQHTRTVLIYTSVLVLPLMETGRKRKRFKMKERIPEEITGGTKTQKKKIE